MSSVYLNVLPFRGIEDIKDVVPFAHYHSQGLYSVDELDLYNLDREIRGGELNDLPDIFVRRLSGAVRKAMKDSYGWNRASHRDQISARQRTTGHTLRHYGLIATRYVCEDRNGESWHTSVDLLFEDGTEISCPAECRLMWDSTQYICRHLNAVNFQGGEWVDKSDWSSLDHLFSHGH